LNFVRNLLDRFSNLERFLSQLEFIRVVTMAVMSVCPCVRSKRPYCLFGTICIIIKSTPYDIKNRQKGYYTNKT